MIITTKSISEVSSYPIVCKTERCKPNGECSYLGISRNADSNGHAKGVLISKCSCEGKGITKSLVVPESDLLYKLSHKILRECSSLEGTVKNFVIMALDIVQIGLESQTPFVRFEDDSTLTFCAMTQWLDKIKFDRVSINSIVNSYSYQSEKGLVLRNDYLIAGYFSELTNGDSIKGSGILNRVMLRDRDAILENNSRDVVDAKNASLGLLVNALNRTYFIHNNPLHEIQWMVGVLLISHNQFEDRELNSMLRIAIHYLWKFRDGETDADNMIVDVGRADFELAQAEPSFNYG